MLHGKIEINHVEIGSWSAVNVGQVFDGVYNYECVVEYRNNEGYPKRAEFMVRHVQSMGALALTTMVLRTALSKMK